MRTEVHNLLEQAKNAAANERSLAVQKAKHIHEQADARLNQALRDAGRIVAEAEKRAEQVGGDAYTALRDKELLEQAAEAMRNVIEGYGDRYLIPTHSLLKMTLLQSMVMTQRDKLSHLHETNPSAWLSRVRPQRAITLRPAAAIQQFNL